jgi:hypothetical protein
VCVCVCVCVSETYIHACIQVDGFMAKSDFEEHMNDVESTLILSLSKHVMAHPQPVVRVTEVNLCLSICVYIYIYLCIHYKILVYTYIYLCEYMAKSDFEGC